MTINHIETIIIRIVHLATNRKQCVESAQIHLEKQEKTKQIFIQPSIVKKQNRLKSNQIKSNFIIFTAFVRRSEPFYLGFLYILFSIIRNWTAICQPFRSERKKQHNKISLKCRHTVLISVNPFHLLRLVVMRFFLHLFSPTVLNFFLFICF